MLSHIAKNVGTGKAGEFEQFRLKSTLHNFIFLIILITLRNYLFCLLICKLSIFTHVDLSFMRSGMLSKLLSMLRTQGLRYYLPRTY